MGRTVDAPDVAPSEAATTEQLRDKGVAPFVKKKIKEHAREGKCDHLENVSTQQLSLGIGPLTIGPSKKSRHCEQDDPHSGQYLPTVGSRPDERLIGHEYRNTGMLMVLIHGHQNGRVWREIASPGELRPVDNCSVEAESIGTD